MGKTCLPSKEERAYVPKRGDSETTINERRRGVVTAVHSKTATVDYYRSIITNTLLDLPIAQQWQAPIDLPIAQLREWTRADDLYIRAEMKQRKERLRLKRATQKAARAFVKDAPKVIEDALLEIGVECVTQRGRAIVSRHDYGAVVRAYRQGSATEKVVIVNLEDFLDRILPVLQKGKRQL